MKELTVEAKIENIGRVTDFVNEELLKRGCSKKSLRQINIAIDELFGNIARYAYPKGLGTATVKMEVEESASAIITFIDKGVPFNPLEKADPDVTLGVEEREIGGLGLFIVKNSMDDVKYKYKDGQNILTIKKIIV